MAPKKFVVKLKVQGEFLKTLPSFAPPKPKRVKKIAAEDKKPSTTTSTSGSKASSPAPEEAPTNPSKINTGVKEMSTAGLTVHSINLQYALDKSGAPCNKWGRSTRQIKSFSGFQVKFKTWKVTLKTEKKTEIMNPEVPQVAVVAPEAPAAPSMAV